MTIIQIFVASLLAIVVALSATLYVITRRAESRSNEGSR